MSFQQLIKTQIVPATINEVWDFISSPKNLKEITPDYMGFNIISKNLPEKIYPGMIISYKVRPLFGIPMAWVTEITHVVEKKYFVDEQRVGPYAMWHHQHFIEPHENGVNMMDIVSYKPPMGFLGSLMNAMIIRRQLESIFAYREKVLKKRFPVIN
jgi:ligand-binding SRPBCC domain-containing protein